MSLLPIFGSFDSINTKVGVLLRDPYKLGKREILLRVWSSLFLSKLVIVQKDGRRSFCWCSKWEELWGWYHCLCNFHLCRCCHGWPHLWLRYWNLRLKIKLLSHSSLYFCNPPIHSHFQQICNIWYLFYF